MKVLNLRCEQAHRFEGWFASEDDYQSQQQRAVLNCPVCDSKQVVRLPSAPRLNVSKAAPPAPRPGQTEPADRRTPIDRNTSLTGDARPLADPGLQAQARWWQAVHHVLRHTEDVGDRFPEEARRIHHGEAEERGIRGRASPDEARALKEEGIEVAAFSLPDGLKNPLQ